MNNHFYLSGHLRSGICLSHRRIPRFDQIGAIKNLIVTKLQLLEERKEDGNQV